SGASHLAVRLVCFGQRRLDSTGCGGEVKAIRKQFGTWVRVVVTSAGAWGGVSACQPGVTGGAASADDSSRGPRGEWERKFEQLVNANWVEKRLNAVLGVTEVNEPKPALITLLQSELDYAMAGLSPQSEPVYWLAYEVTDRNELSIGARDGGLVQSKREQTRSLDVDVRVGDYKLDQTKALHGEFERGGYRGVELLPVPERDVNEARTYETGSPFVEATRNGVWIATNRAYEAARQRYQLVAQSKQRAQG